MKRPPALHWLMVSIRSAAPGTAPPDGAAPPDTETAAAERPEAHQVIDRLVERLRAEGLGAEAARLVVRFGGYGRNAEESRELYGKVMGTIATPEKFAGERLRLAQNEWRRMKANNSQECRNCHNYEYFDYSVQGRRSNQMHQTGFAEGKTCIDCHKGVAHSLPPVDQDIGVPREGVAPDVMHPPARTP